MAFELEALVGHLYIAAGRVIRTTPPGALVEVAPRRAARGRETDTFFVLVLPSGTHAPTSFYEQMTSLAAERYFNTGGSVTSALRELLNTLNHNLHEHNQGGHRPYEANMICAVLRGDELFIARVGAAAAILRYSGRTFTYPEDLSSDEALYQPPLGVQPMPIIHLKRFKVDSGSRLLLLDSSVAEIRMEQIVQALSAANLEQVLDEYKLLVTLQTQVLAAEFVPPEEAAPVPAIAGNSTREISRELAQIRSQNQPQTTAPSEGEPAPAPRPTARANRPNPLLNGLRRMSTGFARAVGETLAAVADLLQKIIGRPPAPDEPRVSSKALTAAVIGLPLLIVLVVVLSWASGVGETAFETCVRDATEASALARSIDSNQRQSVLAAWQATLTVLDRCDNLREGDLFLANLRIEAQTILDVINVVKRRQSTLLAAFPNNASISRLVLQGVDLYALDSANSLVYRISIAPDGVSAASPAQPVANMRRNASVDGILVGEIFDIDFDDQNNTLVAIDRSGLLVSCPPNFIMRCNAQRLPGTDRWSEPLRMNMWRGNLYVLDPTANQLFRYTPSGTSFASLPTNYFVSESRPNLNGAIDFDITRTGPGVVYVLYENGVMTSYLGSQPQNFTFVGFPDGQELRGTTVTGMYLNDSAILPGFYIASRARRSVYVTTLAGTYQDTFRVFDESVFELLSAVAADPGPQILYAASGNSIFALRMAD